MNTDLVKYLNDAKDKPFVWGRNDCLTFSNGAVKMQRGDGFIDEYLGGYTSAKGAFLKYIRAQRESIYTDIIDLVDDRLHREYTLHPDFGFVVARKCTGIALGWAFGIAVRNGILFLDEDGARVVGHQHNDLIWSVS